jgi:hypothetical protein
VRASNNRNVVGSQGPLAELAQQITSHHEAAEAALRTCAEHAMAAGDLLIKAKQQVGHGSFGEWVEYNCKMSYRTARVYMQLADSRAAIETKMAGSANLNIAGALKLISGPPKKSAGQPGHSASVVAAKPKRVTHCDLLGLWTLMPAEERRAFFDGIGMRAVIEGIPDAWLGEAIEQLIEREHPHKPQPKKRQPASKKFAIPDDLSIPQFLKAPANGEAASALAQQ